MGNQAPPLLKQPLLMKQIKLAKGTVKPPWLHETLLLKLDLLYMHSQTMDLIA